MKSQNLDRLKGIVSDFRNRKILVVGDLILDEFVWGNVSRISPEAPVPVVWLTRESSIPGGACNVASNINALGAKAYIAGVIGDDERGARLKGVLDRGGIDSRGVVVDKSRPTTLKTRVVAHHQQVVRIDKETVEPLKGPYISKLFSYVKSVVGNVDGVIIEDYGKGVVTPNLLKKLVPLLKAHKKIVAVDPKEEHFSYYKGVSLITPNQNEVSTAVGFKIKTDALLNRAGRKLLKTLNCKIVLITLGESGMSIFQKGSRPERIPTIVQEVYDVSGAGDTVITVFTMSLLSGATPIQAAHIANCAAGIVVGKVGTAVVSPNELIERIKLEIKRS